MGDCKSPMYMAGQIGMTVFAGFAFAGANKILGLADKNEALDEQKRHNEAVESYTRARDKFNREETERKDKIAKLKADLQESRYAKKGARDDGAEIESLLELEEKREPQISDYYHPSDKFVKASYVFMGLVGGAIGFAGVVVYKLAT